ADEENVLAIAELAHRLQVARWLENHAGGSLDQRLHHHCGDLTAVSSQGALQRDRVAGGNSVRVEQQGTVERMEEIYASHRDGAEGVSVVSAVQAYETRAGRM